MFQVFFFLLVELPSMFVMTIHRLVGGPGTIQWPIWAYRLIGFSLLMVVFIVFVSIAGNS
jgi:hypothetical protein